MPSQHAKRIADLTTRTKPKQFNFGIGRCQQSRYLAQVGKGVFSSSDSKCVKSVASVKKSDLVNGSMVVVRDRNTKRVLN